MAIESNRRVLGDYFTLQRGTTYKVGFLVSPGLYCWGWQPFSGTADSEGILFEHTAGNPQKSCWCNRAISICRLRMSRSLRICLALSRASRSTIRQGA